MNMTGQELKCFHSYINASKNYLEFGAGDSTVFAAQLNSLKQIDSVESSEEFVADRLLTNPAIQVAIESKKLTFHLVDLGPTGDWGYPVGDDKKHLWPNYSLSIFSRPSEHDLVLVDGRFRVACALSTILSCSKDTKIAFHDFWSREEYHVVLDYLDVLDRVEDLAILTRKASADPAQVKELIASYQYKPEA